MISPAPTPKAVKPSMRSLPVSTSAFMKPRVSDSVRVRSAAAIGILAGPTESEGVGGFVEAMARQQNKSKDQVEKEFFEHARPSSLLKRFATVDEVAAMATYVASELSSATNGADLRVDGGVVKAIL